MAVDQQQRVGYRWGLVAESGGREHRLTPRAGEPIWVTEASLVDPADAGQGAVDACVEIGTRDLVLASLSAERPRAVLQTPVLLDEEFCFYVMPQGGDSDPDSDADADTDDGVAVYFEGVVFALSSRDTEEGDEEAVSSENGDDEKNHEEESEGTDKETEEDGDDAMSSYSEDTASSEEEVGRDGMVGGRVATAVAVSGLFAVVYLITFIIIVLSS